MNIGYFIKVSHYLEWIEANAPYIESSSDVMFIAEPILVLISNTFVFYSILFINGL